MSIGTLPQLKTAAAQVVELANSVQSAAADHLKLIASANGDSSRSAEWKIQRLAQLKSDSRVPTLLAELKTRYSELMQVKPIWTVPLVVLSREPLFPGSLNKDSSADNRALYAAQEAAIKDNLRAELLAMPLGAANLLVLEWALTRAWAKVYTAAITLPKLDISLDALPIEALEEADAAFYGAEVGMRSAEIAASETNGRKESSGRIALGLLSQEHDRRVAQRRAGLTLNYDERQSQGVAEAKANDAHLKALDAIPGLSIDFVGRPSR